MTWPTGLVAAIPSPSQGVWHLGPFPVRAYALCILAGIVVSVGWANRRWVARGGRAGAIADMAIWAVPAGIVGARLYNVITDSELYFAPGRNPWDAFAVWHGGLGIWGGVAGGPWAPGYACRRYLLRLSDLAWAVAPTLPVAQAIGRLGNWFNQELYGRPSTVPWALLIDSAHRPAATQLATTYQPTFLYELLWDLGVAALVVWAQRRFRLSGWASFALYVAAYTAGRGWIEALRDDYAHRVLGLRINDWTSILLFLAAVLALAVLRRRPPPGNFGPAPTAVTAAATGPTVPGNTPDDALPLAERPAGPPRPPPR